MELDGRLECFSKGRYGKIVGSRLQDSRHANLNVKALRSSHGAFDIDLIQGNGPFPLWVVGQWS